MDGSTRELQARHRFTGTPAESRAIGYGGLLIWAANWDAFGCNCRITGRFDTLHRAVGKLSVGPFTFVDAPSPVTPTAAPQSRLSFISSLRAHTLDPSVRLGDTMTHLPARHPTIYPSPAPASCNPAPGASFDWQRVEVPAGAIRCLVGVRKGAIGKGFIEGHRANSVSRGAGCPGITH